MPYHQGEYSLGVKYNGFVLPSSPMRGWLGPRGQIATQGHGTMRSNAAGKVKLTGVGLVKAVCHEDNYFIIDGSKTGESNGSPHVALEDVYNGKGLPVQVRSVAKEVYEACYNPKSPGELLLNVTWAGRLVKGCPLKIKASGLGAIENTPASKVKERTKFKANYILAHTAVESFRCSARARA